ncbi:cytochrome c3 family protein [Geomesophilobacter sediminis]|uniref:Cytochrome c3 family protein n=1 Tax=Geomesophilobacter sediminis TaxID=2798584 RepID=A0A8J7LZ44_9BACT|nr:cytochrome c3 family protein [Geomesophilobacter sediminis]MBJ6726097.1 cytochrome c3 family protein [Geomesophilobacter sediminis]
MTAPAQKTEGKGFVGWGVLGSLTVVVLLVIASLVIFNVVYPVDIGTRQPIPFSHRVHVHTKHLSCVMCHTGVTDSQRAGIPPLQTCLLCHEHIITTFPYIQKLRDHFQQRRPVVWQRVNWLPEFVYFYHSVHVSRGIDCSVCHGNVALMDRVIKARKFEMGFCIQCHRDNNATHDCFTCHR